MANKEAIALESPSALLMTTPPDNRVCHRPAGGDSVPVVVNECHDDCDWTVCYWAKGIIDPSAFAAACEYEFDAEVDVEDVHTAFARIWRDFIEGQMVLDYPVPRKRGAFQITYVEPR